MILDDNSREISFRNVELVSLKDNTIVFHLKYSDRKQTKTYESFQSAKEEFDHFSRRIENYMIVKSGRPVKDD